MFCPPGTGKTLLAKVVATKCGTTFMNISCASLLSKWYGESTQLVWCLFDVSRAHAPTTIFIDEIDSLCSAKGSATEHEISRRVKSELLVQINGLNSNNTSAPGLDIEQVARRTKGYNGDDLTNICRDASLNGMRRKIAGKATDEIKNISKAEILKIPVTMDDFLEALDKIQPMMSISKTVALYIKQNGFRLVQEVGE
ncbi:hypothetical protein RND71_026250 [Anisodus tanguticus]|uniref:AAA+ ATPase domain-containing protein n=1 Tax=Anisodus tanguticus TaxID=243964 RepID=A0AAE1V867_9SOLA|nr:hypothetical protein RND71_026250 [Anisodus tanguticus]